MTIGQTLLTYWPIIVSLVAVIVWVCTIWFNLNSKVTLLRAEGSDRDKEIAELKGRINTMQPDLGTIKTDIAVIKNTLEYIKGTVQSSTNKVL